MWGPKLPFRATTVVFAKISFFFPATVACTYFSRLASSPYKLVFKRSYTASKSTQRVASASVNSCKICTHLWNSFVLKSKQTRKLITVTYFYICFYGVKQIYRNARLKPVLWPWSNTVMNYTHTHVYVNDKILCLPLETLLPHAACSAANTALNTLGGEWCIVLILFCF